MRREPEKNNIDSEANLQSGIDTIFLYKILFQQDHNVNKAKKNHRMEVEFGYFLLLANISSSTVTLLQIIFACPLRRRGELEGDEMLSQRRKWVDLEGR